LKGNNKVKVPPNYENDFKKAELVFLYQRVFDIETERLVTLNPVTEDLDISLDTDYIGSYPITYVLFTPLLLLCSKDILTQII
jgi:hypothetical protein